jgi:hypothetical protein
LIVGDWGAVIGGESLLRIHRSFSAIPSISKA